MPAVAEPPRVPPPDTRQRTAPAHDPRRPATRTDPALLNAILTDYHRADGSLPDLAERHGLTAVELLEILESPEVSDLLDRLARQAHLQAERIAAAARPVAMRRLRELARHDPGEHRLLPPAIDARMRETSRKAAAQIARETKPGPGASLGFQSAAPDSQIAPAAPTAPTVPAAPAPTSAPSSPAPASHAALTNPTPPAPPITHHATPHHPSRHAQPPRSRDPAA